MGAQASAEIRGADIGVLENFKEKLNDDQIETIINNPKIVSLLEDYEVENIPSSPLDLTDTLAEIRDEPSDKFEKLVPALVDLLQAEYGSGI